MKHPGKKKIWDLSKIFGEKKQLLVNQKGGVGGETNDPFFFILCVLLTVQWFENLYFHSWNETDTKKAVSTVLSQNLKFFDNKEIFKANKKIVHRNIFPAASVKSKWGQNLDWVDCWKEQVSRIVSRIDWYQKEKKEEKVNQNRLIVCNYFMVLTENLF